MWVCGINMDFKCIIKKVVIVVFIFRLVKDCILLLFLLIIKRIMLKMIGNLVL